MTGSTLGMADIDEDFLQRLIDRHSNGAMWHAPITSFLQVKDESLVEIDLEEEASRLAKAFGSARQLIFRPLTDPTSRKRLGGCFAWRNQPTPMFSEEVDVRLIKMFLHLVESETAQVDASHVVKQKETFVSSVSHELSMPVRLSYINWLILQGRLCTEFLVPCKFSRSLNLTQCRNHSRR